MKKVIFTGIIGILVGTGMASFGVWALLYGTDQDQRLFYRLGIILSIACSAIAIYQARLTRKSRLRMEAERRRYEEGREQYEESTAAMRRAQQAYENIWRSPECPREPVRATGVRVYPQPDDADLRILFPETPLVYVIEPIHPAIEWGDSWSSVPGAGNARPE